MKKNMLKTWQVRIFILCWVAYAAIYFGRVNISIALPDIQDSFGWSKAQVGLIGSLFFWTYGVGHLINGYIGDKMSGRVLIFLGLIVTALTNLFFGFSASLVLMMVLWSVNGYFQSMLWGPMVRMLSHWYPHERRSGVVIGISTSMVGGYLLAWGLAGQILARTNWKWTFWVPGIAIFVYAFLWYGLIRNHPVDVGLTMKDDYVEEADKHEKASMTLWQVIWKTKLWLVVIGCFAQGIIKEGIALWGPTFLMETQNLDIKVVASLIMLIPGMNFVGITLAGWLNKKLNNQDKLTAIILLGFALLMIIGLVQFGRFGAFAGLIFLGCASAAMFGANTILLGVVPMSFAKYNRASSVAGFLDFCSYLAAGFAASVTGLIVEHMGWNGVMIFWIVITATAIIALAVHWMDERKVFFKSMSVHG